MKKLVLVVLVALLSLGTVNAQKKGAMKVEPSLVVAFAPTGYNMGFGANGTMFYGLNDKIDLTATIGYITWGSDFDGISLSTIPVLVGGRYSFAVDGAIVPYAAAELGLHFMTVELPSYQFMGTTIGGDVSSSEFGFGIGGGAYMNIGSLAVDGNVQYNSMGETSYLAVKVGVVFAL